MSGVFCRLPSLVKLASCVELALAVTATAVATVMVTAMAYAALVFACCGAESRGLRQENAPFGGGAQRSKTKGVYPLEGWLIGGAVAAATGP